MTLSDPARHAKDAAEAIGAVFEDLDNGAGYLFRISKNGRSLLAGAGPISSFPVNSATAVAIARDKAFTKTVLARAGLPVIPGGLFFAHQRRRALRGPGREIADAHDFAAKAGWPVFAKPNSGGRGNFAEIVADDAGLADYARRVAEEFESFLIEPVIRGPEHRVLVQDGRAIFHSAKSPAALTGDGAKTLQALLVQLNANLAGTGVSPWPASVIVRAGRSLQDVPASGERVLLPGRRNLSAEGGVEHISSDISPPLRDLGCAAIAAIGLRIGAVDIFDRSLASDCSDLVVIEVNGNPGLKALEASGRSELVSAIWISMLRQCLEEAP